MKTVDGLDVEGPVDNEGALLGVDAVVRDAILSGEEVVDRVPVAAQDRIGAQIRANTAISGDALCWVDYKRTRTKLPAGIS